MQTLKLTLFSLFLSTSLLSSSEEFKPLEWFAGVLEKTEPTASTAFQRIENNIAGLSVSRNKCSFLFYSKGRVLDEKLIVTNKGRRIDIAGKEKYLEYQYDKNDFTYNRLLGYTVDLTDRLDKIIFVVRFSNTPTFCTRIECDLDPAGNVIQTSIRQVNAKVEFPHADESPEGN